MSIDQQFVEFVIKSLVTKPEAVQIERRIDEKGVLLELTVDPEDLGRVIGKRGATAQSVRTLLRALGTKNDARYNLKIVDNGVNSEGYSAPAQAEPSGNSTHSEVAAAEEPAVSEPQATNEEDAWASAAPPPSASEPDEDEEESEDEEKNDAMSKTRRELRDLDDLDV